MPTTDQTRKPPTILVVEDNAILHEAFCEILEMQGYRTVSAMTGREALRLARDRQPNLILLDIMLPDMLGWEIQHQLSLGPPTASVPVLGISAIGDPAAPSRALAAGFAAFLPKPVRMVELIRQVESLLELPPSGGAATESLPNR